ncbi:lanthionine synthetase [Streptomyces sp. CB02959]|uniref:lanthionine synthetase C family protein n=1 Tax=Streptomyces sp. CB02959 TaxID=2020330 RepID=UPI000C27B7CD|nr:lanthionine synthetase C family protein [Streptomyces sp. CB02959]PJN32288.1 lanthionine synthetase [Streptomyces sp. CB02959]
MTTKAQAAHIASRYATVLSAPPPGQNLEGQSLADGAAGIALLHIERAQARTGPWKLAHRWINHAAAGELDATDTAGLFRGAPALAFVLLNTVPHGRFQDLYCTAWEKLHHHVTTLAHQRTERALARIHRGQLTTFAEYDLFCGLTGIGAYLLRADPTSSALEQVLHYLVALTHPVAINGHRLPGWWVAHDPNRGTSTEFAQGHGNLGVAHGISGPLLLLAQALRRGVSVDGQHEAIDTICSHLDAWRQDGERGPWWPLHLTLEEFSSGRTHQRGAGRPSWCYGTPGIARAGQLAGIALGDRGLQHMYEAALYLAMTDPEQLALIRDTSLCHGWAGVYQTTARAAHDSPYPHLRQLLPRLGETLTTLIRTTPNQNVGLLTGNGGCALALSSLTAGALITQTGWDACLLID